MQALGCPGVVSCPLELVCYRMLGLVFSRTASSVVSQTLPEYLQSNFNRSSSSGQSRSRSSTSKD